MAVGVEEKIKQTICSYDNTVLEYFRNTLDIHPAERAKEFRAMLPHKARILDHGCGPGRDSKIFSNTYSIETVGFDLSRKMVEHARYYAPRAEFCVADMRSLPFASESFDGIWSVASVLNIPKSEIPLAISEACRVLKKGGVFYLRMKRGEGEMFELDKRYNPPVPKVVSYFSPAELAVVLEQGGFSIETLESKAPIGQYQKITELNVFSRRR